MTMEAGVVIDLEYNALHWHIPPGRSAGGLPDSPDLWEVLWANRENLRGVAHSHPGGGIPAPSFTDVTTFTAVEAGLGKRLDWWIISSEAAVVCNWAGPGKLDYAVKRVGYDASWIPRLRELSNY